MDALFSTSYLVPVRERGEEPPQKELLLSPEESNHLRILIMTRLQSKFSSFVVHFMAG